jgi:hypothetical protein
MSVEWMSEGYETGLEYGVPSVLIQMREFGIRQNYEKQLRNQLQSRSAVENPRTDKNMYKENWCDLSLHVFMYLFIVYLMRLSLAQKV